MWFEQISMEYCEWCGEYLNREENGYGWCFCEREYDWADYDDV